jgi:uncharacterized protein (UPF0179 family)
MCPWCNGRGFIVTRVEDQTFEALCGLCRAPRRADGKPPAASPELSIEQYVRLELQKVNLQRETPWPDAALAKRASWVLCGMTQWLDPYASVTDPKDIKVGDEVVSLKTGTAYRIVEVNGSFATCIKSGEKSGLQSLIPLSDLRIPDVLPGMKVRVKGGNIMTVDRVEGDVATCSGLVAGSTRICWGSFHFSTLEIVPDVDSPSVVESSP